MLQPCSDAPNAEVGKLRLRLAAATLQFPHENHNAEMAQCCAEK